MFFLAPQEPFTRPQPGSPRMFRVDWIERYLSRVRPWHVVSFWAPWSLYCLLHSIRELRLALVAPLVLFGVFLWTFLEYLLHRFLFHFPFHQSSEVQRDLSFLIHGVHHGYPSDPDRLVMPPVITVIVAALVALPLWLIVGQSAFYPIFGGILAGYLWYDLTHYAIHNNKPRTRLGRWQKSYHMSHHFKTPEIRYGVTTPLWDFIFRTRPKSAEKD